MTHNTLATDLLATDVAEYFPLDMFRWHPLVCHRALQRGCMGEGEEKEEGEEEGEEKRKEVRETRWKKKGGRERVDRRQEG